jgi:hypothetical protein
MIDLCDDNMAISVLVRDFMRNVDNGLRLMLLLLLLLFCAMPSFAAVYKCKATNGDIAYSDKPCVGGGAVMPGYKYRDPGTTTGQATSLGPESTGPAEPNSRAVGASDETPAIGSSTKIRECGDIEIVSFAPFDRQRVSGGVLSGGQVLPGGTVVGGTLSGGTVSTTRCAKVAFRLRGPGSRIGDNQYAKEVAGKLMAVFADGSTRPGAVGSMPGGRVSAERVSYGTFCFGQSELEIVDVQCH